jgi:hypothetical protein
MNLDRIISLILRQLLRRLIGKGVNAGIGMAARRGGQGAKMTEEKRRSAGDTGRTTRRARQAARLLRRFGRF